MAALLGVDQVDNFLKYLGLSSFVGRNKRVVFAYIKNKIRLGLVHGIRGSFCGQVRKFFSKVWPKLCLLFL